jgi:lysophospholipid hydrolase
MPQFSTFSFTSLSTREHISPSADFERLARILFGQSIALVLGGGGARGVAHLGFLQAFEEEGIPIDIVGGTSMGAFVGAVYSRNASVQETHEITREFSRAMLPSRLWTDITLPLVSVLTGKLFNNAVVAALDGEKLASSDLKLDYYCNATNLTRGVVPEFFMPQPSPVWKFARASMGILPLLPPFPIKGQQYVDGCYMNNVPVSPAQMLGAGIIFAVDITNEPLPDDTSNEQTVSGWAILGQVIRRRVGLGKGKDPWGGVPSHLELQDQLGMAVNSNEMRIMKETPGIFYYDKSMKDVSKTSYANFEEVYKIGYTNAKDWLKALREEGKLNDLAAPIRAKDQGYKVEYIAR